MMRLISIDPGTVTCGIALWSLDSKFNISDLKTFTLIIDKDKTLEDRYSDFVNYIKQIYEDFKPHFLAHEAAFINRFRPQAYGPIYTVIYILRSEYTKQFGKYGLFSYPPKLIKSIITKGDADKDDMFTAVNKIKEIKPFLLGDESEHVIDAIAIGYSFIKNSRETKEILLL